MRGGPAEVCGDTEGIALEELLGRRIDSKEEGIRKGQGWRGDAGGQSRGSAGIRM